MKILEENVAFGRVLKAIEQSFADRPAELCELQLSAPLLVAIAGGSGSGKSTLARQLTIALGESDQHGTILPLDHYYKDFDDPTMPHSPDGSVLFDVPESFLVFPYLSGLRRLLSGQSVQRPVYSQVYNKRVDYCWVQPAPVVIAEGLFAISLVNAGIWRYPPLKIFLESDLALCRERRLERDVRELGETPEQVAKMFDEQVVPCYHRYVLPQRALADIIINPPVAETRKESDYATEP